ncbi:DUF1553 domain-containing protein [Schlesneria sp. T3-172]|uniref:DUF1553 domain-containing protein n=1 Tax=Schlesneria sphaerica TaxID=3373610 RepID=UPI0037C786A0
MRLQLSFIVYAAWLSFVTAAPLTAAEPHSVKKIDFNRDIKPILSNACYRCHGPDPDERKGGTDGLRFDTAEGVLADLGGYAAVVPGKPEASALVQRITTTDPDQVMPPRGAGKPLTPHEVDLLKTWIEQGAKFSQHWSYIVPQKPPLPAVQDVGWVKNGIDYFILARLEAEGLKPAEEADRYALIRRVALDLTGLPPTVEEVNEFINDESSTAFEKVVDRMLAKPAFGEHWGLAWLDLARYADSAGYADDPARRIWLYRDYVVKSFNDNKPFDQFTIEQIAGDLLPHPTDEQLIATAFHRNTMTNNEGGTNDEEFRNVAVVDRVNTTMAVWMGTTMACAQCHTHKYDPITQEEYFRFFAFFNNTEDADRGDESPLHAVYTEDQLRLRSAWQTEVAQLEQVLKTETPELTAARAKWDEAFPKSVHWNSLIPRRVRSQANSAAVTSAEGSIKVASGATSDTYTIEIPATGEVVRALRLEALPDEKLPGNGPGHSGGNFVLSGVTAVLEPPAGMPARGRYVRVELPGEKYLSLAEVQIYHGSENIALKGEASQISTAYDGEAKRAIDGNTNGDYFAALSTTHTGPGKDPWWEVDLKSDQPIDRITLWNRTDGAGERLSNFRIVILDERREPVWKRDVAPQPNPSSDFVVDGNRPIEFEAAVADYSQPGFDAAFVINNKDPRSKGWAVGGATGQPHSLTLFSRQPVQLPSGWTLKVTIEHASQFAHHNLGHFRLSVTKDEGVNQWARTPAAVIAALKVARSSRSTAEQDLVTQHFLTIAPELAATRQQIAQLQKLLADLKPETVPVMKELTANRRVTKLQYRGNFEDLGPEVTEGIPAALGSLPAGEPVNRLTLAKWLVDPKNPLTARVIANRYWEQLFGIGIVSTSEEFGSQGDLPFHPELLDWLACELTGQSEATATVAGLKTQQPWDNKAFLKTLVMSAAYRQSSRTTPDLQQRDPDNRLIAHGPRFRLSAETLRDQALFVSGLLSRKMAGPPVKPPQPSLGLSAAFGSSTDWQTSPGEDKYRRGIYTTWRRSNPYPSMATFDAPNREVCTVRRVRTNTPLQALVSLNDPVNVEAAQALARRIVQDGGHSVADRATYGFRRVLIRPPHPVELKRLVDLYEQSLKRFEQSLEEATQLATDPLGPAPEGTRIPELAAWSVVGNVLLNLDETVMKR